MNTDDTDKTDPKKSHLLYEDLTFEINGILFNVHNELGPYAREKQYCDSAESLFKEKGKGYQREVRIGDSNNIVDGIVEGKVLMEYKCFVEYKNK